MYFFIHGGAFQKITLMRGGGHAKKIGNRGGGVILFSNYTPPNPTSPPYPMKNERSLNTSIILFLLGDYSCLYTLWSFFVWFKSHNDINLSWQACGSVAHFVAIYGKYSVWIWVMQYFRLFILQLHKLTSDLIFICINWFAGNLAEIAEEDEANFTQFSYTPENGESLKS